MATLERTLPPVSRAGERHIGALDGLRGAAVLLVLFNHFTPDLLMPDRAQEWAKKLLTTGGWVGVDLFFVLSGFLITGILLRTKERGSYFLNFYARRTLRIFPLYYGTLIVIFLALPTLGVISGSWFGPIQDAQGYHWLYATNFAFWLLPKEAVFADGHLELRHFWSLAVEEHFYLVWPAIVFASGLRSIRRICIALIVSALVFRLIGIVTEQPVGYFTLTFCRWDALAAGALVAVVAHERGLDALQKLPRPVALFAASGALVLAVYFFVMKGLWPTTLGILTLGLPIIALTFAAIVFLALYDGPLSRFFSFGPLRSAGKYSYGAYVIHGLIALWLSGMIPTDRWLALFGQTLPSILGLAAVKIAVSFVLAWLSWHLYESQFLKLKRYFTTELTTTHRSAPPVWQRLVGRGRQEIAVKVKAPDAR